MIKTVQLEGAPEFLAARLDEIELTARFVETDSPRPDEKHICHWAILDDTNANKLRVAVDYQLVLADVEVKRNILRGYGSADKQYTGAQDMFTAQDSFTQKCLLGELILQFIQPYADHPDFNSAWLKD